MSTHENVVFLSQTVQIRNSNVLDMYGNNTMLLQAKDEEGMLLFYAFCCVDISLLLLFPVKSPIHRMDIIDRTE